MFDGEAPRVFGVPPGADFPKELISGLEQRLSGQPPEAWAATEIFVNTRRMHRRLMALFDEGPARLLPRIRLVSEIGDAAELPDLPQPVAPLRRRLELGRLVAALLERQPDLAPSAALFDLSDSLAALLDEMQGEGVSPRALQELDVSHLSAHWERTRTFLKIVEALFRGDAMDAEARRRLAVTRLAELWQTRPPGHPIIVAGSTGSRGTTALFMEAVARLPQGAVVLPGYDFDQPGAVWSALDDVMTAEDHPQFRFRALARRLNIAQSGILKWHDAIVTPNPARNRLISLALRPAPVTDQWLDEGPRLADVAGATEAVSLIEAPSPQAEAAAIALRLRRAAEEGVTAALITPDRTLTRQVTAALDRWAIEPDDSAGMPLPLSAPGRFLRQVSSLFGQKMTAEALLSLLKHPLACSTADMRGPHLLWTRELELHIRRRGVPFPSGDDLMRWAQSAGDDDGRTAWAGWLGRHLSGLEAGAALPLSEHVDRHLRLAEGLAAGPGQSGAGALWEEAAGIEARRAVDALLAEAPHGGEFSPRDYRDLFRAVLARHEVHSPERPHPRVMIWGTLEARVQGADLVILGGLNEGAWPETPPPDPWLNREMRLKAGLLLPERRIGLAAHDFQQAVAAREVVLTRAVRDAEAETVPSRWLNRLVNLMGGLHAQGGPAALDAMRRRGDELLALAEAVEAPDASMSRQPAPRPSPCPPVNMRPTRLSVTRIQTLIRDPYAIYAAEILRLRRLSPLRQEPDAPLRGTILHRVLERFIREGGGAGPDAEKARLLAIADEVLAADAPWPAARRVWRARLARVADWLVSTEAQRRQGAVWAALEVAGSADIPGGFTLSAEADRIDRREDGRLVIYDYKTGTVPSRRQVKSFDKQLLLEAAIAERGGFEGLPAAPVGRVAYIGLGSRPEESEIPLDDGLIDATWEDLKRLIGNYSRRQTGYTARRAVFKRADAGDYDHLSRYGEWDASTRPERKKVGK